MRKLFVKYNMELYRLSKDQFISQLSKTPSGVKLIPINEKNLKDTKPLYPKHYKEWHKNLRKGAEGLFAVCGDQIVGYGWLKKKGSKDPFYRFEKGVAYLSGFFVENDFRGLGIYPALLSQFIISHPEYHEFFISAYTSNISSRNGLLKVGFKHIRSLTFVRASKITLNKYKIV